MLKWLLRASKADGSIWVCQRLERSLKDNGDVDMHMHARCLLGQFLFGSSIFSVKGCTGMHMYNCADTDSIRSL